MNLTAFDFKYGNNCVIFLRQVDFKRFFNRKNPFLCTFAWHYCGMKNYPPTVKPTATQLALLDAENLSILRCALGVEHGPIADRNHYVAPATGGILHRCHILAEAGFLYFAPSTGNHRTFLVTEYGAAALGFGLDPESLQYMRYLTSKEADLYKKDYLDWRESLRLAQISGVDTDRLVATGRIPAPPPKPVNMVS
jgi:hypothetical protein